MTRKTEAGLRRALRALNEAEMYLRSTWDQTDDPVLASLLEGLAHGVSGMATGVLTLVDPDAE